MPSIQQKLPMHPKTGGMGRINNIDSNDTSRYHPPPNNQHDKIIISKSGVRQIGHHNLCNYSLLLRHHTLINWVILSSVPQFLSSSVLF